MGENTRLQTMQVNINKLTEQSNGHNEQLASITQTWASIQVQLGQCLEHSPRTDHGKLAASFAPLRQMKVDFPRFAGGDDVM